MRRNVTIRARGKRFSIRFHLRTVVVLLVVVVLLAFALAESTAFGEVQFPLLAVLRAVLGLGNHLDLLIVREFRLPRALEGALVGAMLGMSGALFQRMVNNPLVAPDIIGVNEGAAAAAVAVIILGAGQDFLPLASFGGGLAAAAAGYFLSLRRGLSPYRLVLVGIAINAVIGALIEFLMTLPVATAGQVTRLASAESWLAGSLNGSMWSQVQLLAIAFVVLFPAAVLLGRGLDVLSMGEDAARSLSVRVGLLRSGVVLVGVLLAAFAVSMCGPIGFVAFISPHVARRLARNSGAGAIPLSGAVGALLLVLADYLGKRILEPTQLPVGVVTVALGAPYFIVLLYRAGRRGNLA